MSEARFRRLVDEYIEANYTVSEAITLAANAAARYEDPYEVMKREAQEGLDNTTATA